MNAVASPATYTISVLKGRAHITTAKDPTWDGLRHAVENPDTVAPGTAKDNLPAWAPGRYLNNHRCGKNLLGRNTVWPDLDHATDGELQVVIDWLKAKGVAALIHTTYRHPNADGTGRYRVIVPLSREVGVDEWNARIKPWMRSIPGSVQDENALDAVRFLYAPVKTDAYLCKTIEGHPLDVDALPEDASAPKATSTSAFRILEGAPLSVDDVLAIAPATDAPASPAPLTIPQGQEDYYRRRAAKYIADQPYQVAGNGQAQGPIFAIMQRLALHYRQSKDSALKLLAEWNTHNRPVWTDEELEITYDNALENKKGIEFPPLAPDLDGLKLVPEPIKTIANNKRLDLTCARHVPLVLIAYSELCSELSTGDWQGVFRFNRLAQRHEAHNPPCKLRMEQGCLSDGDIGKVRFLLEGTLTASTKAKHDKEGNVISASQSAGLKADPIDIRRAIETVAEENSYNPMLGYLDSLPRTDGTPELDQAWKTILCSPEGALTSTLLKKHMVAAVRRARASDVGQHVDHQAILVLCGKQDAGKTELVKRLGGPHYVSVVGALRDKDTILKMQGALTVDLEEMATANKADREMLKTFLSRSSDFERAPYARAASIVARSYVLFGSHNSLSLDDPTGLRRFWCIPTGDAIDWRYAAKIRDVLWAEANTLAATDYDHHLTRDEKTRVAELASGYEKEDPLAERLRVALQGVPFLKVDEAYHLIVKKSTESKEVIPENEVARYRDALRRIGCENVVRKLEETKKNVRGWLVPGDIAKGNKPTMFNEDQDARAVRDMLWLRDAA